MRITPKIIILTVFVLFKLINARTFELCHEGRVYQDRDHQRWQVLDCTKFVRETREYLMITPGVTNTANYVIHPDDEKWQLY